MTLNEVSPSVSKGLPFRRAAYPSKLYYYYDLNDKWFIQVNSETGCELITFTLDLKLEDLTATDWEVDEWDDHIPDADEKVNE
jgi:hypothetical protein